jgi:hypothetical protein
MCVEAQDAEAVLAAVEQWVRRVQVVHGAWCAQSAERSGMVAWGNLKVVQKSFS